MMINALAAHIHLKFIYVCGMFKLFCVLLFLVPWLTQPE